MKILVLYNDQTEYLAKGFVGEEFELKLLFLYFTADSWNYINTRVQSLNLRPFDAVVNLIEIDYLKTPFPFLVKINAEFSKLLSEKCDMLNKKYILISTASLYGNNFEYLQTVETCKKLDTTTDYRLSKLLAEKYCNQNDLILRIKNSFDGRGNINNYINKMIGRKKLFNWVDVHTYIPDLVNVVKLLVEKNKSGIYNVVSFEAKSAVFYLKNILKLENYQHLDGDVTDDPNLINELDDEIVHGDVNNLKLGELYKMTPMDAAMLISWAQMQNTNLQHTS